MKDKMLGENFSKNVQSLWENFNEILLSDLKTATKGKYKGSWVGGFNI